MSKMENPKRTTIASKIAANAPKNEPSPGSLGDALMQQPTGGQTKIVKAR